MLGVPHISPLKVPLTLIFSQGSQAPVVGCRCRAWIYSRSAELVGRVGVPGMVVWGLGFRVCGLYGDFFGGGDRRILQGYHTPIFENQIEDMETEALPGFMLGRSFL